jgi:hypothetical protein
MKTMTRKFTPMTETPVVGLPLRRSITVSMVHQVLRE